MAESLLVTIRANGTCRTHSFDESVQSVLWLGIEDKPTPATAMARLSSDEDGIVLCALRESAIVVATEGVVERVRIPSDRPGVYVVRDASGDMTLHVRRATRGMRTFSTVSLTREVEFEIGRGRTCGLRYENPLVSVRHAKICVRGGSFSIRDLRSSNGTFANGVRLEAGQPRVLAAGDVVQVLDLTFAVGVSVMCLNAPDGLAWGDVPGLAPLMHARDDVRATGVASIPADGEYEHAQFYPAPRLTKSIHPFAMSVDDPPPQIEENRQPAIMQVGPSFLMGLTSVFMAANGVARIAGGSDVLSAAPSIAMAVAMVGGSIIWPLINRGYMRRRQRSQEALRRQAYVTYLDGVEDELGEEVSRQRQVLLERRVGIDLIRQWARDLSPMLMNRTSAHDDFMELRVGLGDCPAQVEVAWPKRRFALGSDPMLERVLALADTPPTLRDVPLAFDPARHFVAGVVGARAVVWDFVRGLIAQMCALYSYQELKLVLLANEAEREEWDFVTSFGHCYDEGGRRRLVALSNAGMAQIDVLLERELEGREKARVEVLGDLGTYYLVVCASARLAERSEAVARLLDLRHNLGFSLVYLGAEVRDLPRECSFIIDLGQRSNGLEVREARMFERADVAGTLTPFDPDVFLGSKQAHVFALDLARAHLGVPGRVADVPESLGFLEMLEVGSVAHLNVGRRWAENDASRTLQTRIGMDAQGESAYLDLHENVHGPHALVAGTTGSGKSEFIITYILSLCVSYSPDEVAFVLIDYKGGGLAGAFENDRHHLPHLAGTITNLDGGAIRRALVSIQSELRRRQRLFNEARDLTGESTMDIYRYLSFYRQGLLSEPLPHLFVIADEFAELKQQEPDFMSELVSAARIGRSLGVHLVLATQKPSGVVDDQIWSNARLKVSLKVSDVADSREMIRRDDAATISRPGQYFMLVGYDDSFGAGQAAYAGGTYVPMENFGRRRDEAVELIDAEGRLIAAQRPPVIGKQQGTSELAAVLKVLEETAASIGKCARRLWLEPLPAKVTLDELSDRYGEVEEEAGLACVVGELDDPECQEQRRFVLDLACVGNVMLYGSAGSDVDGLAKAMLVSLAQAHAPECLWIYALDLGNGGMAELCELPHVGGVVLAGDEERARNLFRLLESEVTRRRELATAHALDEEPAVVVAIANLAAFLERFESLEDRLVALTRDSPRYGIHFVVTAASASTPRMRLRANFGMSLPTMLNDPADYGTLVGRFGALVPPQTERRGIAKVGKRLLEFQGVSIAETLDAEQAWIAKLAHDVRERTGAEARRIPVLPRHVSAEVMGSSASVLLVPVGFSKERVEPVHFDLARSRTMLVLGNDLESITSYLRGLLEACERAGDEAYRFVDPQRVLGQVQSDLVVRDEEEVCAFVRGLDDGSAPGRVVVFTSIVQTVAALPERESAVLQGFLATERDAETRALVVATELWRAKSLYADWYRVVTAYSSGIWVGGGFADQTTFAFGRPMPEYRQPAARSDGFLVVRGVVEGVRLLEDAADKQTDKPQGRR